MVTKKKPDAMKVGAIRWGSYKPGSTRFYRLEKVVNKHGGITNLSPSMTKKEAHAFAEGWNGRLKKGKRLVPPGGF